MFSKTKHSLHLFVEGESVNVRSRVQIAESLDSTGKLDGCLFMAQMYDYCDQEFQIQKVVTSFFSERQKRSFKPKAPIYILKNLVCEGKSDCFPEKCDHGCLLFWHEKWLEKVEP